MHARMLLVSNLTMLIFRPRAREPNSKRKDEKKKIESKGKVDEKQRK